MYVIRVEGGSSQGFHCGVKGQVDIERVCSNIYDQVYDHVV